MWTLILVLSMGNATMNKGFPYSSYELCEKNRQHMLNDAHDPRIQVVSAECVYEVAPFGFVTGY